VRLLRLLFLFSFLINRAYCQCLQDAVWCFGDSAGIDFSDTSNISVFTSAAFGEEACTSISDCSGNLLFYTGNYQILQDIFSIYNYDHLIIENGDSLLGDYSKTQGAIIIPFINSIDGFYLFHLKNGSLQEVNNGLYYSVIDMSINSGEGKVVIKNVQLYSGRLTEKMCATKNSEADGYWLLNLSLYADTLIRYLVDENGIQGPFSQVIDEHRDSTASSSGGQMVFDRQGQSLAINAGRGITVFDFDRCTGLVSNMIAVCPFSNDIDAGGYYYGLCFSPSGRFLYSTKIPTSFFTPPIDTLFQFDLNANNICASRYFYPSTEALVCPDYNSGMGQMALARDGRIYLSNEYYWFQSSLACTTNTYLSVINSPNQKAPACNFEEYSFYLGGERSFGSLPNMPNYNLGPIIPPTVDAGEGTETCSDQPIQLEAVSCSTCIYDWQPSEFLSNANIVNPIATVNTTTTFSLIVTDTSIHASCNKTSTDTVTVFVTDNTPSIQTLYIVSAGDEFFLLQDLKPNTSIEIISINGQRVYQTDSYQNDLELKNLSAGMYYYKMNLPGCYKLEGKFVVVR